MGWPADAATRRARSEAHETFDRLWKLGGMSRTDAYAWMRARMSLDEKDAHIGMFDRDRCRELVRLVEAEFPHLCLDPEPI